ncbi:hypothetical protein KQI63_14245 [bacterium]|nr:hypothetical protein [bacterium]
MRRIATFDLFLFALVIVLAGCTKEDPSGPGSDNHEMERFIFSNLGIPRVLDSYSPADTSMPRRIALTLELVEADNGDSFLVRHRKALDWYPIREREGYWFSDSLKVEGTTLLTWMDGRWLPYLDLHGIDSKQYGDTLLSGYYVSPKLLGVNYTSLVVNQVDHTVLQGKPSGSSFTCLYFFRPNWPGAWVDEQVTLNEDYGIVHLGSRLRAGGGFGYKLADSSLTFDHTLPPLSPGSPSSTLQSWFPMHEQQSWTYGLTRGTTGIYLPEVIKISVMETPESGSGDRYKLALHEEPRIEPYLLNHYSSFMVNGDYLLTSRFEGIRPAISLAGVGNASPGDTLYHWEVEVDWDFYEVIKTIFLASGVSGTINGVVYDDLLYLETTDLFDFGFQRMTLARDVGMVKLEGYRYVEPFEYQLIGYSGPGGHKTVQK